MEKHEACKIERQNKNAVVLETAGEGRINKEEENKLAGPRAKKDALKGMVNGKKVRGRRRYQMIDNIMINDLYEDTKRKAEKRVEWRMLSLQ